MGNVVRFPNVHRKIAGARQSPATSATITILPVVRIQRSKVTSPQHAVKRRLPASTSAPSSRR